jgi:hypothetical protein
VAPARVSSCRSALLVELKEPREDLVVRKVGRPAIGGGDGGVELAVGVVEPGGALVVEIGEGALLQDCGGLIVDWYEAVRVPGRHLRHALDEIGRVEPSLAQLVEPCAFNGALTARIGVTALEAIRPMPFRAAKPPRMRDVLAEALRPLVSRKAEGG